MSSSNSSTPKTDQKLQSTVVAVEEMRPMNNPTQGSPQEVVSERMITERPNVGLRVVQEAKSMMKQDDIVYICDTCKKEFQTPKSLNYHRRVHTREKELERQRKKTKTTSISPGQGTSNLVGDALSNDNHLRLSRDPLVTKDNTGIDMPVCPPVAPDFERLGVSLSDIERLGLSFGPFKYRGGGSISDYTMAPPVTPYGSSSSIDLLPSHRYNPHAVLFEHSLDPSNFIGSSSNNNSSSPGSLSLELSLGPPKSMGDSNNYTSLNGGVTGGGTVDLNMPVRPRVSRYHSVTRDARPLSTTNLPNDKNVSGSSFSQNLIAKEKDKTGDHDEGQP